MRDAFVAVAAWSTFVVALLFFSPGFALGPACGRLVGRSAACEAELAAWSERLWWGHTTPLLAFVAAGYVAIGVMALLGFRRRRRGKMSAA